MASIQIIFIAGVVLALFSSFVSVNSSCPWKLDDNDAIDMIYPDGGVGTYTIFCADDYYLMSNHYFTARCVDDTWQLLDYQGNEGNSSDVCAPRSKCPREANNNDQIDSVVFNVPDGEFQIVCTDSDDFKPDDNVKPTCDDELDIWTFPPGKICFPKKCSVKILSGVVGTNVDRASDVSRCTSGDDGKCMPGLYLGADAGYTCKTGRAPHPEAILQCTNSDWKRADIMPTGFEMCPETKCDAATVGSTDPNLLRVSAGCSGNQGKCVPFTYTAGIIVCDTGYSPKPDRTLTCEKKNQVWQWTFSDDTVCYEPKCNAAVVGSDDSNLLRVNSAGCVGNQGKCVPFTYTAGSIVCETGYFPKPDSTVTCEEKNQEWQWTLSDDTVCYRPKCYSAVVDSTDSNLLKVNSAGCTAKKPWKCVPFTYTAGSIVCDTGYSPKPDSTLTCEKKNKEWQWTLSHDTVCQAKCNASIVGSTDSNLLKVDSARCVQIGGNSEKCDHVTYTAGSIVCDSSAGYFPKPGSTVTCEENGEWTLSSNKVCRKGCLGTDISNNKVSKIAGSKCDDSGWCPRSVYRKGNVRCKRGYKRKSGARAKCRENNGAVSWDIISQLCEVPTISSA